MVHSQQTRLSGFYLCCLSSSFSYAHGVCLLPRCAHMSLGFPAWRYSACATLGAVPFVLALQSHPAVAGPLSRKCVCVCTRSGSLLPNQSCVEPHVCFLQRPRIPVEAARSSPARGWPRCLLPFCGRRLHLPIALIRSANRSALRLALPQANASVWLEQTDAARR